MELPLVSVVCLSHNHGKYLRQAIDSVLTQTHPRVELILVDDASTDNSLQVIEDFLRTHPDVSFINLRENHGNCKAFNKGFRIAKGEFIIDLAADDLLLPDRIRSGISAFSEHSEDYGVNFTNAELIDGEGKHLGYHSERFPHHTIPQGDIYRNVVERYFINSPTMMIRRTAMERLGGYDESLAYEDFDFWIRSSREFKYCYTPEVLVQKRILPNSMVKGQSVRNSMQRESTYRVCLKIPDLNRTPEEGVALKRRVSYELKKSLQFGEFGLALKYFQLLRKIR